MVAHVSSKTHEATKMHLFELLLMQCPTLDGKCYPTILNACAHRHPQLASVTVTDRGESMPPL